MMSKPLVDFNLNVGMRFEEAADGPSIVLFTTDSGPVTFDTYRVVIGRLPDGQWRAQIPLMPQYNVIAATREDAKKALEATVMAYLRERQAFIHDAVPLVERYIIPTSQHPNGTNNRDRDRDRDAEVPTIKGYDQSVSSIMRVMGDAFAASSIGDDSRMIDTARIADTAKQIALPEDVCGRRLRTILTTKS